MLTRCFIVLLIAFFPVFVRAEPLVIAATNWAPYTDEKLENSGFFAEICQAALAEAGYESRIVFLPWKRAVKLTKAGQYHALLGASFTREREPFFAYPEFYWENPTMFFAGKDHPASYGKVKDLCPARLGLFAGSFYEKRFRAYGCFEIQTVSSTEQNIKKLAAGRVDLILDSKDSINYFLANEFAEFQKDIKPLSPPLEIDKLYMVISKKVSNYGQIRDDFDRGIKALKADGSYDRILIKHGLK